MAASLSRYLHAMMCAMAPWAPAGARRPWAPVWWRILGRNCKKIAKSDILNGERLPWAGPLWFGDVCIWLTQMGFFGREGTWTVCTNAKRPSTRMHVRDISRTRPLGIMPAFVTLVSDAKNFHKQRDRWAARKSLADTSDQQREEKRNQWVWCFHSSTLQ